MTLSDMRRTYREHIDRRDDYMQKARKWRDDALATDNIAKLFQAEDFAKVARVANHHALAWRRNIADWYGETP